MTNTSNKIVVDAGGDVLVVGLGGSGKSAAALVDRLGGRAWTTDDALSGGGKPDGLPDGCEFLPAADAADALGKVGGVVVSPGVPRDHALLVAAVEAGLPVVSEPALASQYLDCQLVGITGTNGKSTTVSLIGAMLAAENKKVFVGGNLGEPLSDAVGRDTDVCVVELSSFQLEWPGSLAPDIGAVLNISPDHLDRHGDMLTYIETKMRLFERMGSDGAAVFSYEQDWWREAAADLAPEILEFAVSRQGSTQSAMRFDPQGRILRGTGGWEARISVDWPNSPFDFENLAAAALIARRLGVGSRAVAEATADFKPLGHRLQRVAVVDGVEFWNDSKATNIGAALASLEAFTEPVILMTGGVAKGTPFAELTEAPGVKLFVAYGEAGDDIAASVGPTHTVERRGGFDEAFDAAVANARPGDIVLLAPACASFDEFSDYAARGEAFESRVEKLRQQSGWDR